MDTKEFIKKLRSNLESDDCIMRYDVILDTVAGLKKLESKLEPVDTVEDTDLNELKTKVGNLEKALAEMVNTNAHLDGFMLPAGI